MPKIVGHDRLSDGHLHRLGCTIVNIKWFIIVNTLQLHYNAVVGVHGKKARYNGPRYIHRVIKDRVINTAIYTQINWCQTWLGITQGVRFSQLALCIPRSSADIFTHLYWKNIWKPPGNRVIMESQCIKKCQINTSNNKIQQWSWCYYYFFLRVNLLNVG